MTKMHNTAQICLTVSLTGAALVLSNSAFAAEATQKVIAQNAKLQVIEVMQKPGDTGAMQKRDGIVVHWITGGKVERTYGDGSKQVMERKDGETALITEKRPYSVKNVGTTTTHLIEVVPK